MIPKMSLFGIDTLCLPLTLTFEIRLFLFSLYGKHWFLMFYSRQARQKKKIALVKSKFCIPMSLLKLSLYIFPGTWFSLVPLFYSHVKKLGAWPRFLHNVRKTLVAGKALLRPQGRNQMLPEGILWLCPATPGLSPLCVTRSPGLCPTPASGPGGGTRTGSGSVTQACSPKVPGKLCLLSWIAWFSTLAANLNHLESYCQIPVEFLSIGLW